MLEIHRGSTQGLFTGREMVHLHQEAQAHPCAALPVV